LAVVGWERSQFEAIKLKEMCEAPFARFPKQRISRFWELWVEFAAQNQAMMKPVMLPTEPMVRLFLVEAEFGNHLERSNFFDAGAAAAG